MIFATLLKLSDRKFSHSQKYQPIENQAELNALEAKINKNFIKIKLRLVSKAKIVQIED